MDVNEELKFFVKIQKKKKNGGGGGRRRGRVWGGQCGCDRRIEKFFGKNSQKKKFRGGGGGGLGGVRVDVNEELKFL